jgi:hypothetical protein
MRHHPRRLAAIGRYQNDGLHLLLLILGIALTLAGLIAVAKNG